MGILLDCAELYLSGLFVGDGWFDKRGIAFSTKSTSLAEKIAELISQVYKVKPRIYLREYRDGHKLYVIRVWSVELLRKYQMLLKTNKKKSLTAIPPDIEDKSLILCFIKGVYDAESWIYTWRGKIRVSIEIYNESISKCILDSLYSLNIKAYLSRCSDGAYRIDVTGEHASNLLKLFKYIESRLTYPDPVPESPGCKRCGLGVGRA